MAHDVAELRYLLSEAFDWGALLARLKEIRHHYCDAFMDGKAGERAAMVIVEALAGKESSGYVDKMRFLNMSLEYVYAIDMFWGYVEKTRFFKHI